MPILMGRVAPFWTGIWRGPSRTQSPDHGHTYKGLVFHGLACISSSPLNRDLSRLFIEKTLMIGCNSSSSAIKA